MPRTISWGAGTCALAGLPALACRFISIRSTGTPQQGGFWGQERVVLMSKHTTSSLCPLLPARHHVRPALHPACLPPAPHLPPPAPGTHPGNVCWERQGLLEPEVGQFLGEPLVLDHCCRLQVGPLPCRWRGAGLLAGFVPGAKEMVLSSQAKGILPWGPDPAEGRCVAAGPRGCWSGEQRVPTPCLWVGSACGVQFRLWVSVPAAGGLPAVGVPDPKGPSSSSPLSPRSRFPRPGGPWLI